MSKREFEDNINPSSEPTLIEQFERMLHEDESVFFDTKSFEKIIDHYDDSLEFIKGLKAVNLALIQYPFSSIFLYKKAELLFELKKNIEALDCLEKAEVFDPADLNIYLLRAEIYTDGSKYEEGIKALNSAFQSVDKEEHSELYLEMGDIYFQWDKSNQAFSCLKKSLLINPKNAEAHRLLESVVDELKNYTESIQLNKKLTDKEPYSELAWYNLGKAYKALDLYEKAVDAFDFTIAIEEKYEPAYIECAKALYLSRKFEEAISKLEQAKEMNLARSPEVFYHLGQCYLRMNNTSLAKYNFRKASQLNNIFHQAYYGWGKALEMEEDYLGGFKMYHKALSQSEYNSDYAMAAGCAAFRMENYDSAESFFSKALELNPKSNAPYLWLAKTHMEDNEVERAIETLDEGICLLEAYAELLYYKAGFLIRIGKKSEALIILENALDLDFDKNYVLFELMPHLSNDDRVLELIETYR